MVRQRVMLGVLLLFVVLSISVPAAGITRVYAQGIPGLDDGQGNNMGSILETISALNPPLTAVLMLVSWLLWRSYQKVQTDYTEFLKDEVTRSRQFEAGRNLATIQPASPQQFMAESLKSPYAKPQ